MLGSKPGKPKLITFNIINHSLNKSGVRRKSRKLSKFRKFKLRKVCSNKLRNTFSNKKIQNKLTLKPNHSFFKQINFINGFRCNKSIICTKFINSKKPLKSFKTQTGLRFFKKRNFINKLNLNYFSNNLFNLINTNKGSSFIPKDNSIKLKTRTQLGFIMGSAGLFILNKLNLNNNLLSSKKFKYKYKKEYYSFLYPNQLKKNVMFRKKKIVISRFFTKNVFSKSDNFRFSLKQFSLKYKSFFVNNLSTNNYAINKYGIGGLGYSSHKSNILYRDDFYNMGNDESFSVDEVFISRVRFKPGYQRM